MKQQKEVRMSKNLVQKILHNHLVEGKMEQGNPIKIKIDQTLTQDATGTMAYLQFETLGIDRVRTDVSVSYVDHNTLQSGFENADDHRYLQSVAAKYGIWFSKPGNGICHQLHLENFGIPGKTMLGSDSHTPTGGGIGMIAIGAGGLDVALAMAGIPFEMTMPSVVKVHLTGKLPDWVSAKDVILELLRRKSVKGGVGKIFEYSGPGVANLSVPQRATITNMGAELGATTSIFPSDEQTRKFLQRMERVDDYRPLQADDDAQYDEVVSIDLSELEPMVACPHSPDNIKKVKDLAGMKVNQVAIGSCTNSSYQDMMITSKILEKNKVHPDVNLGISFGSKQIMEQVDEEGGLESIIRAGARILENACGPCIGMGFSPPSDSACLRTFNRNFYGRSGTKSAGIYLVSPETAAVSAIHGELTDPREFGQYTPIQEPDTYSRSTSLFLPPVPEGTEVEVIQGPNIAPCPVNTPFPDNYRNEVLLKVEDNITTDHIMPAGAKILPLRSNIPKISEHCFEVTDPQFPARAKEKGGGFIVGGENYGQGSSREHAALAPMYLGIKCVIARSFSRIHLANLVNFGILPLIFDRSADYESCTQGDVLYFENIESQLREKKVAIYNETRDETYHCTALLNEGEVDIILAGGKLNAMKEKLK